MCITTRVCLCFCKFCKKQSRIKLPDTSGNVANMYLAKVLSLLGRAVDTLSERSLEDRLPITDQKNGLEMSILKLLKAAGKILIAYFFMQELDDHNKL